MRMRLGFFSFVHHLLFSLRLCPLPALSITLASLSRGSQTTTTSGGNNDDNVYESREKGKEEKSAMDITSLTKLVLARLEILMRRDVDILNVATRCRANTAMVIENAVAKGNNIAVALIVN